MSVGKNLMQNSTSN